MDEDKAIKAEHDYLTRRWIERAKLLSDRAAIDAQIAWIDEDIGDRQHYFILCDDGTFNLGVGSF